MTQYFEVPKSLSLQSSKKAEVKIPRVITGFESTRFGGTSNDILDTTNHSHLFRHDLGLIRQELGISEVRYSIPWHKIESVQGQYDWRWMDSVMNFMALLDIKIIADPWHHTSHPEWLKGGLTNPQASIHYAKFVRAFAIRYPQVNRFTIFNEPFATTFMAAHQGIWYPHVKDGPRKFINAALNVAKIYMATENALREIRPTCEIVYVDTCEHHSSFSSEHQYELNERRFIFADILLGRGRDNYYLQKFGFEEKDMRLFDDPSNQAKIDLFGLDYYCHLEYEYLRRRVQVPSSDPLGFARVARQYHERYRQHNFKFGLTETNYRGQIEFRLNWLAYMLCETIMLGQMGIDLEVFCWYPAIDSTGWGQHYATRTCQRRDHTGIYWLDAQRFSRNPSELTEAYGALVKGELDPVKTRHYLPHPHVKNEIGGHYKLMQKMWAETEWFKADKPHKIKDDRRNR